MIKCLQGKKMYIAAAAMAIAAVTFFFLGQMDGPTLTMALTAAAAIAGLSARLNRYLPDMVTVAQDLKAKNYKAAISVGVSDAAQAATKTASALILFFALAALAPSAHGQCRLSCAPRAFGRTARTMVTFHENGHRAIGAALTEWAIFGASFADARTTVSAQHRDPAAEETSFLLGLHPSAPRVYATEIGSALLTNMLIQESFEHNKKPWYVIPAAIPIGLHSWAAWHNSDIKGSPAK